MKLLYLLTLIRFNQNIVIMKPEDDNPNIFNSVYVGKVASIELDSSLIMRRVGLVYVDDGAIWIELKEREGDE